MAFQTKNPEYQQKRAEKLTEKGSYLKAAEIYLKLDDLKSAEKVLKMAGGLRGKSGGIEREKIKELIESYKQLKKRQ